MSLLWQHSFERLVPTFAHVALAGQEPQQRPFEKNSGLLVIKQIAEV
jgi:hypothetical protein